LPLTPSCNHKSGRSSPPRHRFIWRGPTSFSPPGVSHRASSSTSEDC
jgi:hypothetical protein